MSAHIGAILLGLLAAFLFALSAYYEHRVARHVHPQGHSVLGTSIVRLGILVRDGHWRSGWLVNLCGFGAQAAALHFGSVASVQPLLVTQLMFALPMSSLEQRRWPRFRDLGAAALICAGLVLLLVVVPTRPMAGTPDRTRIMLAAIAVVAAAVILVPASVRLGRTALFVASATCAGMAFAMTGVFIKLTTTDLVYRGVAYTARDWVGYALAGSTVLGLMLAQTAFAHGPLPWAVAAKEAVNPVASYAIGVLAFPVSMPTDAASLAGIAGAGALVITGALTLGGSPSVETWLGRPGSPDPPRPGSSQTTVS